ncbi:MAG: hypothetical protein BGO98_40720 [Myxococcales bacterium 68-20]|nr:MAG: hypothetical protein BGO98_40720 [Myxococcales bacterium 68-20]
MTNKQLQAGDFVTPAVRLVRPLAEGGMGRVWVAEHQGLHAQVVVKLMAPEMAERPDGAERFAREAAVCAATKSPHVVQVFDHGVTDGGTPYIVMELLEGKDLGAHLVEHVRMAPVDVVTIIGQIGKALSKAHKASIIHRDIKPENIFLCDTETERGEIFVKLLDFGTARRETERSSRTTVPGQIMGTPYYMSPEQSVGSTEIDERSDIWSLGVVAFEALTGQKPFDGASVGAITIAIHGPLPKMTDLVPDLPAALDAWFARACAQLPQDRFASVREATSALVEAVTGEAPLEQATESVCVPVSPAKKETSTPVQPVTRPITPLSASLPPPGAEKRIPTIAAGAVMAAAAAAMIAIVLGRSPEAQPGPAAAPATPLAAEVAPSPAAPPPAEPPAHAANEAADEAASEAPAAREGVKGAEPATAAKPPARATESLRDARAKKAPKASQRGARVPSTTEGPDDDLVRLANAASKHGEPQPPETAPPATAVAPPVTAPPPLPAPSPAPSPEP